MEEIMKLIEADIFEKEGKRYLSCESAHKLARVKNIPLIEIGDACNKNGIKIAACQLGCFK